MIRVRFSNGQVVEYPNANHVVRNTSCCDLLTKRGGTWVAQVPQDVILELYPYSAKVIHPAPGQATVGFAADVILNTPIDQITYWDNQKLKALKVHLTRLNRRTGEWK